MTLDSILGNWAGTRAPRLLLVLDYDGTLVDIAPRPQDAAPDPGLRTLLERLLASPGVHLAILSGRALSELRAWLELPDAILVGSHGAEWCPPRGAPGPLLSASQDGDRAAEVARQLESALAGIQGALVERKGFGTAAHCRRVAPAELPRFEEAFRSVAAHHAQHFEVLVGRKVLELRPPGVSKGAALAEVRHRLDLAEVPVLAAGDDRTDEETFAVLGEADLTAKVGTGETMAAVRLPDPTALRALLDEVLRRRAADGEGGE